MFWLGRPIWNGNVLQKQTKRHCLVSRILWIVRGILWAQMTWMSCEMLYFDVAVHVLMKCLWKLLPMYRCRTMDCITINSSLSTNRQMSFVTLRSARCGNKLYQISKQCMSVIIVGKTDLDKKKTKSQSESPESVKKTGNMAWRILPVDVIKNSWCRHQLEKKPSTGCSIIYHDGYWIRFGSLLLLTASRRGQNPPRGTCKCQGQHVYIYQLWQHHSVKLNKPWKQKNKIKNLEGFPKLMGVTTKWHPYMRMGCWKPRERHEQASPSLTGKQLCSSQVTQRAWTCMEKGCKELLVTFSKLCKWGIHE